jgi:16S rRNA (cytosine967-C5)-methyltransferase
MVQDFLADHPAWRIKPVDPASRWPGMETAITELGEVRTHPAMLGNADPACRLGDLTVSMRWC